MEELKPEQVLSGDATHTMVKSRPHTRKVQDPPPKGFHQCPYGDQLWNGEPYCSWGALPNDNLCTFDPCRQVWEADREGERLFNEWFLAPELGDEEEEKRLKGLLNVNGVLADELKIRLYKAHRKSRARNL